MGIYLVRHCDKVSFCNKIYTHLNAGAMVLAHSLRDNGTSKQLAVLVTMNSLSASTIDELKVRISHQFWIKMS